MSVIVDNNPKIWLTDQSQTMETFGSHISIAHNPGCPFYGSTFMLRISLHKYNVKMEDSKEIVVPRIDFSITIPATKGIYIIDRSAVSQEISTMKFTSLKIDRMNYYRIAINPSCSRKMSVRLFEFFWDQENTFSPVRFFFQFFFQVS